MKQKSQLKNWLLNNFDTSNNGVVGGEVYFSANFGINDKFTFLILNNVTIASLLFLHGYFLNVLRFAFLVQ